MAVPTHNYYFGEPAVGLTAGYYNNTSYVHKFGHNGDVGTAWETLWNEGGIYVYPAAATAMQVSSSDVNDDDTDTGAWTVEVQGLDANYNLQSEIVTLNGQSQVGTSKEYIRVFRARVLTAGTSGWNEGIIYIGTGSPTAGKPSTVYGLIEPFVCQTLMALYTVPLGYKAYSLLTHFSSSVSKKASAGIFARPFGQVFQIKEYHTLIDGVSPLNHRTSEFYPEKTDLEGRSMVAAGGGDISCQLEYALIKAN